MRRPKPQPVRNKIDLTDPAQIRAWTKRLDVSRADLHRMIEKVGNSISALTKEIGIEKAHAVKASSPTTIKSIEPEIPPPAECEPQGIA